MESVLFAFDEWLRGAIADGIIWNFTGLLDSAQDSVDEVAGQVSMSPATFSPGVFNMITAFRLSVDALKLSTGKCLTGRSAGRKRRNLYRSTGEDQRCGNPASIQH